MCLHQKLRHMIHRQALLQKYQQMMNRLSLNYLNLNLSLNLSQNLVLD